jgi:hypothetical protein
MEVQPARRRDSTRTRAIDIAERRKKSPAAERPGTGAVISTSGSIRRTAASLSRRSPASRPAGLFLFPVRVLGGFTSGH